jgi:hypothetical protein
MPFHEFYSVSTRDFDQELLPISDFYSYLSITKAGLHYALNGLLHIFHKHFKYFVEIQRERFPLSLICISVFYRVFLNYCRGFRGL